MALTMGQAVLLLWAGLRSLWIPLLGRWSHIVIDVFTHSADFNLSPVLYPIAQRGFDGVAWKAPCFIVAKHAARGAVGLWALTTRSVAAD